MSAKKAGPGVNPGDVYAGRLRDGRFGAVHVIRVIKDGQRPGRDSATVVCTRYIGQEPPQIDNEAVRNLLRRSRFRYEKGEPSIMIVDEPPPSDFIHVGNFAPTAEELAIDPMGAYGAGWRLVEDVLMEWRWEHDRDALQREMEAEAAKWNQPRPPPGTRKRTPKSTLTEADFWGLLGALRVGDEDVDLEPLLTALTRRSAADIREFHELLAHKLYLLDGAKYADHAGDAGGSDDAFLYARCYVVARGRGFYEDVLAHPEHFPADVDLESLLYVAGDAHVEKTDDDLDDVTHYSFETGSNAEGWPE